MRKKEHDADGFDRMVDWTWRSRWFHRLCDQWWNNTGDHCFQLLSICFARRILLSSLKIVIRKSRISWDDILLKKKFFNRLAHLAPALVIFWLSPYAFPETPVLVTICRNVSFIYMIIIAMLTLDALLNSLHEIYETFEVSREIHIKGFIQASKIIIFLIGTIVILSVFTSRTPLYFLSGLGALTAVLLLIFKDAILGLVAGIQLSANNMVRKGDWIAMAQFGADGDVIDVSLTTVKVQNWDKTIMTIPTYALISQSFINWRGMQESGGRRIKRALYIDMTSIKFCDDEMLGRFSKIQFIREYLEKKKKEIAGYNEEIQVDDSSLVNGRRLTNVGTFRAYVDAYLRNHPKINKDMTFLIRQLAPTDRGLPLEIYVFSNDQVWARYEAIKADIFDHLLAVLPEFDLRIFQSPTGADFQNIASPSLQNHAAC